MIPAEYLDQPEARTEPTTPTIRWDNWSRPEVPSWKYDDATTADRYGDGR